PARLHVLAKRYLCAVEPGYYDGLSDASKLSLSLQGGPSSSEEVEQFESNPYYLDAVRLRRWDDEAKIPDLPVPGLETHLDRLAATLKGPSMAPVKGEEV